MCGSVLGVARAVSLGPLAPVALLALPRLSAKERGGPHPMVQEPERLEEVQERIREGQELCSWNAVTTVAAPGWKLSSGYPLTRSYWLGTG